jgi:hypothetical protein
MLPAWFTKPEAIYATILFVIGTAISLAASAYPEGARRLLGMPGRRAKMSLLKFSENELRSLEVIHENAYYLLLWLAWSGLEVLNYLLLMFVISGVGNFVAYAITGKLLWTTWFAGFVSSSIAVIGGRTQRCRQTVMSLYNYEKETEKLKRNISLIKAERSLETN